MNSVFLVVLLAMVLIVVLLRFKVAMGPAILAGGLLIWLIESHDVWQLWVAAKETATMSRSWDLLLCLYFVMCLEIELRTSGSLKGLVTSLKNLFSTNKVTLALMPAFLGLLPSIGGARFSSPIVEEASKGIELDKEDKSAINLWFRHIWEFSNPLMPGVILACGIANVTIGDLIKNVGWLTILSFILGWIYLIRPLKITDAKLATNVSGDRHVDWLSLFLAFGPIVFSFLLIVAFNIQASVSMAIVVVGFLPIYYLAKRPVSVKKVFLEAFDTRLLFSIICILYFIQILTVSGVLQEIVDAFNRSQLPQPVIIASLAVIFGIITGMSQGYIALVMPVVALMAPGDIVLVGMTMAFGLFGQMLTPTHVCILVTIDYFKAGLWKTIGRYTLILLAYILIYTLWTWFRYYSGIF